MRHLVRDSARPALVVLLAPVLWLGTAVAGGTAYADGPEGPTGRAAIAHDNGKADDSVGARDNGKGNDQHSNRTDNRSLADHSDGNAGTSGDPSRPQPISNADANAGGANGDCPGGPYCSTRDGSPSANGNGNGAAKGKPCAGCVGKADNKNPKGQYPNGSDHNAGYECDRNHGIGRGNPAHTGCTGSSYPTLSPTGGGTGKGSGRPTVGEDTGTAGRVGTAVLGRSTEVRPHCSSGSPQLGRCGFAAAGARGTGTAVVTGSDAEVLSQQASSALPFTGMPAQVLLLIGLLTAGTGAALTFSARRPVGPTVD